jgi:hypothetical protein
MQMRDDAGTWLAQVQHDLVKRLLWPARDRRDLGGGVQPGELRVALVDDAGAAVTAAQLWQRLCDLAPARVTTTARAALADFGAAIDRAVAAGQNDDPGGVLALEAAWQALARIVKDAEPSGS